MNVGRIEAISIQQINWQILTAREIIDYKNQGLEVPDKYFLWAQEFINSIHSDDDTTYESAVSSVENTEGEGTENVQNDEAVDEVDDMSETSEVDEDSDTSEDVSEDASQDVSPEAIDLTDAQIKRQQMNDDGVSLRRQALSFTQDSKTMAKEASSSSAISKNGEISSNNEIRSLDTQIKELIARADAVQGSLKNEINRINTGRSDYSYLKVLNLQQQLQKYGNDAQARIAVSLGHLSDIDMTLAAQSPTLFDAMDYGTETVSVGEELRHNHSHSWRRILDVIIARMAITAGNKSVFRGVRGKDAQVQSISVNDSNIPKATEQQNNIKEKTGVGPAEDKQFKPENEKSKEENKSEADKAQEKIDSGKATLDEILKRKIRRGEVTET